MNRVSLMGAAWIFISTPGCVSSSRGYREATQVVKERTGVDVRASFLDDSDTQRTVNELLESPLTADRAARVALLHSPEVQAAFDRIGVARGALVAALHLPNPRIEGSVRFRRGGSVDVGLGATINLVDLALLPLREKAASADLDAASLEAAGTTMDVAFEARTAYLDCVAARQSFELAKSITILSDGGADLAKRLGDAGNTPPLDVLNETVIYDESRLALADAEAELSLSRERLNAALGLWGEPGNHWTVEAQFAELPASDPPFDSVESIALQKSLELRIAKGRYAGAANEASLARAQGIIPELNAGVDAERADEGTTGEAWGIGPKVSLGVPLFYQGQGAVDASRSEMRRQNDLGEAMAVQIRSEARALSMRVTKARESARYYRDKIIPLRRQIVEESERQYNAMGASAFQLLAAKRAELESERAHVGALREYWVARAALDLLLSGRLTRPLAHDFGLGVRTKSGAFSE